MHTDIHALSGIRTRNPSIRAGEDIVKLITHSKFPFPIIRLESAWR
jgi:hypothetical protein